MYLVTGVPRSGTTPLGHIFSAYLGYSVLHEPFNYHTGITDVQSYFQFAAGREAGRLLPAIARVRNRNVLFKPGIFANDRLPRRLAKRVLGTRTSRSYRTFDPAHGVIKDPFLCLSLDEALPLFDHLFLTLRPVDGIVNSFNRYRWIFPELLTGAGALDELGLNLTLSLACNPTFYGLYITLRYLEQCMRVSTSPRVTLVNMTHLMNMDEIELARCFRALNLASPAELKANLREMYAERRSLLPRKEFHNHRRGRHALEAANRPSSITPELSPLYDRTNRLFSEVVEASARA